MYTTKAETECRILKDTEFLKNKKYKIEDCYSDHGSTFNQALHFHDFYEISMIYEGESEYLINGTRLTMPVGSVQLIRPWDYHRQNTAQGQHIRYYNLTFQPDMLSLSVQRALLSCDVPLFHVYKGREWRKLMELAGSLQEEYERSFADGLGEEVIRNGIQLLCIQIFRSLGDCPDGELQSQNELIRQAVAYIHQNCRNRITLRAVAEAVGLSPAYFSTFFHESLGITFSRYVTDCRMRMAAQYLRTSDFPLKQVADICGVSGYAYFLTAFKERYGVPPAKYRRENQDPCSVSVDSQLRKHRESTFE